VKTRESYGGATETGSEKKKALERRFQRGILISIHHKVNNSQSGKRIVHRTKTQKREINHLQGPPGDVWQGENWGRKKEEGHKRRAFGFRPCGKL